MKMFILVILALFLNCSLSAQDPEKIAEDIYKKIFENEKIRVFEVTFKPGQSVDKHWYPDHSVYVLSSGKIEVDNGSSPRTIEIKQGETMFIDSEIHSAKNVGNADVKLVLTEIKNQKMRNEWTKLHKNENKDMSTKQKQKN